MNTRDSLRLVSKSNQQSKSKKDSFFKDWNRKLSEGNERYVSFILLKMKKSAEKGYGSLRFTLDYTSEMFQIDEGINTCYIPSEILNTLTSRPHCFQIEQECDHYDAIDWIIYWHRTLPTDPDKVGMAWE